MQLFYLHGFNSSPQSDKARLVADFVAQHCPNTRLHCPALHFAPATVMAELRQAMAACEGPLALIGSSLGGFYATSLAEQFDCQAVLINPAVKPFVLLDDYLGPQQNPYTGEQFEVRPQHMQQLRELYRPVLTHPERYWLLQKKGDEILDWRQAREYYQGARQTIDNGGDHAFTDLSRYLPEIAAFLKLY